MQIKKYLIYKKKLKKRLEIRVMKEIQNLSKKKKFNNRNHRTNQKLTIRKLDLLKRKMKNQ